MIRLIAAMVDGSELDEEFPNHEYEEIAVMITETEIELFVEIQVIDNNGNTLNLFKRDLKNVY